MSIIDRLFSRNSINELPKQDNSFAFGFNFFNSKKYDTAVVLFAMVVKKLMNALKNIQYTCENDSKKNRKIVNFVTSNIQMIVWKMLSEGIVAVGQDEEGEYYVADFSRFEFGSNGEVTNYECVYYSEVYRFFRVSDLNFIKKQLDKIDRLEDTDINLSENFGAVGILTGKGMPINPVEKEEFEKKLKSTYGGGSDKKNILVSSLPLDFSVMTFPVAGLQLNEKSREAFKILLNYFGIPIDLVLGQSTYENQAQAVKNFYQDCIAPLAEVGLEICRHLLRMDSRNLTPTSAMSFRIDNVEELKEDYHNIDNEYVEKLLQNIKLCKELQLDSTEIENELKSYLKNIG